jgi:hypothetical protein
VSSTEQRRSSVESLPRLLEPRGLAWLRSAWPAVIERWLLLGPRRQGEDDPRCSLAWAPLPSPSPPPSLIRCERCAVRFVANMCASRGSGVVWRVSVSGSPRWSGGRLGRVRRGRPPSRPRGAVGSGAAAVESAADSVVSRSLGCVGGLGWL